jgi:8-oxo-dGTP pyrophosphatase MutT (NUDIX family)
VTTEDTIWKPHATVAAICEKDQRFLIVREMVHGKEMLNQPAGHLEPGETLQQAVIRETLEETAYDFTPSRFIGIYRYVPDSQKDNSYLRFAFTGKAGKQHQQPLDEGIISAHWMTLDELHQTRAIHRAPMVLQCVLDYLHKPSYPLQVFSSEFL